ncbi:MAG: helix-turn-helix transcriptional regulator [Phycisphaerales bacterium]|nr:helix-turn-helix transcriptional regulator [Phycisphaerales bacterium]
MKRSPFLIDFGRRLQAVRRQAGLSQEELAHRAKLHQVTVSLLENGRRAATLLTIERLARAMAVAPAQLIPPLR